MLRPLLCLLIIAGLHCTAPAARCDENAAPTKPVYRSAEPLDRGLVVRRLGPDSNRYYVSWRLLADDPADVAFDLYCGKAKLNTEPIRNTTDLLVESEPSPRGESWTLFATRNGKNLSSCTTKDEIVAAPDEPLISFKTVSGQTFQKIGIGDLDGDKQLDYVLKTPNSNVDPYINYWKPSPGTFHLEAYRHDGTPLWDHDLGWAIEQGIWYSPYLVYDLDGDGRCEVIAKTGEGDPRDEDGRVQTGPEYLTVLDGQTGKPITQIDWIDRELFRSLGDKMYNYSSRNQLGIAYLDGNEKRPSLIVARGTYNKMFAKAYDLVDGKLTVRWTWDNLDLPREYQGQGAHWMHSADIDQDGRDEVLLGSVTLDENGKTLWTTGLGHPDHFYCGDLMPDRPGLEIYYGIEPRGDKNKMCMVDARTGEIIWGHDQPTQHIHASGMCSDIDPQTPGWECYSGERDFPEERWFRTAAGQLTQMDLGGLSPRTALWDADPEREILRGTRIINFAKGEDLDQVEIINRFQGKWIITADIVGDWREEIITTDGDQLRVYSTTIPAKTRMVTLLQDPIYRIDTAHTAMGYIQTPTMQNNPATVMKKQ